jgi:hypothetical protein
MCLLGFLAYRNSKHRRLDWAMGAWHEKHLH